MLAASALVTVGVAVRVVHTHSLETTNLVWNLFLAWIPLVLALVVYDGARRGANAGPLAAVGIVWLLFLPNAPYIVTDLKWLGHYDERDRTGSTRRSIGGAAVVGLGLGFVSLYLVQSVVTLRLGRLAGWTLALGALVASGVGVYLGRFERWNSWDVFTEPTRVVGQLGVGGARSARARRGRSPCRCSSASHGAWATCSSTRRSARSSEVSRSAEHVRRRRRRETTVR